MKLKILFEQRLDEPARLIAQNVGKTVAETHGELRRAVETFGMALAEPHYAAEVRKIMNKPTPTRRSTWRWLRSNWAS